MQKEEGGRSKRYLGRILLAFIIQFRTPKSTKCSSTTTRLGQKRRPTAREGGEAQGDIRHAESSRGSLGAGKGGRGED